MGKNLKVNVNYKNGVVYSIETNLIFWNNQITQSNINSLNHKKLLLKIKLSDRIVVVPYAKNTKKLTL